MIIIHAAHIRDNNTIQSIKDHLEGVANLAKLFAESFNSGELAYICGLLHDIGKYSDEFQNRIYLGGNRVDHSTAGAQELYKRMNNLGLLLAYCIAGHHGGLPDGGNVIDTSGDSTLYGRLQKKIKNYMKYEEDIGYEVPITKRNLPIKPLFKIGFSVSFYIRMLFSCLVDSDYLDTESFMNNSVLRGGYEDIESLNKKLDGYIKKFDAPVNEINKKRTEILSCCMQKGLYDKGLYTLTVPTGGGKTISSLAFALKHAKKHKMDRIIYVIPYNSIIEQNASVFKGILGEANVLEHHSNFVYDDTNESMIKQRLATENWDMPVIVTTTVQFFESLFANRTSKCRKLHNISNSIIIFDEAQMFPIPYLLPCVRAISELVHNYGSTAILCSATQPALNDFFPKEFIIKELCDHKEELASFFKGTKVLQIGELDDSNIADRLNSEKQVLCIVNTRKQAQNIFNLLDKKGAYHLSTLMYPRHRKWVLKKIRQRLKQGLSCRVISTSLIEAGVDVDFPVVYRAEAGLDSIIQAAGRCNRERKNNVSPVYVFKPSVEYRNHIPSMIRRPTEVASSIANQFEDISSCEAITAYFQQLYKVEGEGIDIKNIVSRFENGYEKQLSFPFASIAQEFNLIENSTYSIIIPANKEIKDLIYRIRNGEYNKAVLRRIQHYIINVYKKNYDSLYGTGSIEPLDDQLALLCDIKKYDVKTGLVANTDNGIGVFY